MMEPGDKVKISYTGYTVMATILEDHRNGWWKVRQDSDFEDRPENERPTYIAAEEYMSRPDEPRKHGPFEVLWKVMKNG